MAAPPILLAFAVAAAVSGTGDADATRAGRQGRAVPAPGRASPLETPAPPRVERPRGTGQVVQATAARAYLDAGAEDGLAAGADLELFRSGVVAGRCRVEAVAGRQAVCAGSGLRAGDTFRFEAPPEPAPPRLLPPPLGEDELARRRAAVMAAPIMLVELEVRPAPAGERAGPGGRRIVEAELSYAAWAPSGAGSSQEGRLDLALRGAEVGGGVLLDLDARAERWLTRDAPRFRPRDDTRLTIWQAQLTAGPGSALTGPSLSLAAGRVLPFAVPGATIFDGALAGFRVAAGEVGVFGGLVPQPDTLAPTTQRATGGGYWLLERGLEHGALLRQEGRIAVVRSPELGTRVEASLTGRAWLRVVDLSAEAHLGAGGTAHAPGLVDAARVDAVGHPVPGLALGGSLRYGGLSWPQSFEPAAFPGRSRAADLFAAWDLGRLVRVGLTGGLSRDASSGLDRSWVGPELALPRLLGSRGGLTLGYLEERGWLAGRSAWAQLVARPWELLRLVARASWSHERQVALDRDELALLASATAELTPHLGLRAAVTTRAAPDLTGQGGSGTPVGVTGFVTLVASY